LLALIYLRHNVAHEVVGQRFSVSADTSENLFHEVVPLLRELFPAKHFEAERRFSSNNPRLETEQSYLWAARKRQLMPPFRKGSQKQSRNYRFRPAFMGASRFRDGF
jgi:hypothetical protein